MAFPVTPLELGAELFIGDRWVEVTDDVRVAEGVEIQHGSASQDRTVPPARCTLTLDNAGDAYNRRNPLSVNYGKLGRNTPLRISRSDLGADTFAGRTVSNGWGTSSHGEAWSVETNASNYAVSAGVGTQTVPSAANFRLAYLAGVVHRDVDVAATVTLSDGNIAGGSVEPCNLVVRGVSTSTYLMVRLVITTAETLTIKLSSRSGTDYSSDVAVPGIAHSAGQPLRVRAQVEGSTFRAKVWVVDTTVADSTGEPLEWHVEGTVPGVPVAGFVGIRSGVGAGNTDVPVTFAYSDFTVRSNRFAGEIASWPPQWDLAEVDRRMPIEAAGIMRRLGQGASPLRSTLRRSIPTLPDLVAYWPMEDGSESTSFAPGMPGVDPMYIDPAGDQSLAEHTGFPSSEALPVANAAVWRGSIPPYTSTGEVQLRYLITMSANGIADNRPIHRLWLDGSLAFVDLRGGPTPGQLRLVASNNTSDVANTVLSFDLRGKAIRISLELQQNGANIDWGVWYIEVGATAGFGVTGTINNQTLGAARVLYYALGQDLDGTALGHVTVEKQLSTIFDLQTQLNAYAGETATARITRLCRDEGVPVAINGETDPDALMGAQLPATLLELLGECADVDMGVLGESRGTAALKYRTRLSMCNQAATAAIDYANRQLAPPFTPTDDDRFTANDITVERTRGSSYRTTLDVGPMSVQPPPDGAGRYDTGDEVNCYNDSQLPNLAGWLLALGTVDEYRVPVIALDLSVEHVVADTALVAGALSLDLGDRITVDNLGSVGIYDQVSQLVPGYTEYLAAFDHKIEANAVPASPYRVLVADDPVYGLIDSGSSTLTSGISGSATSFQVSTADAGDLWTTDPADFPLDIKIGGERIQISAISGSSSPQTFTVATSGRAINLAGNTKAHSAGAEVHVADPVNFA